MDLLLDGKVVAIAGGSRGIGRYIASALGREGCRLALFARNKDGVDQAVNELRADGVDAHGWAVDLVDPDSGDEIVTCTTETYGRLDAYVGNAGGNRRKPFEETTEADWSELLEVNLRGHLRAARASIPAMRAVGEGSILFVSSVFGREAGGAGLSLYNTTKSALISAAKIMSLELASEGIRVNTVAPGSIRFPGGSWDRRAVAEPEKMAEFVRENIPIGRFGSAEEVADVVTFLVSPRASLITGSCISVDGGQSRSLI